MITVPNALLWDYREPPEDLLLYLTLVGAGVSPRSFREA
jgi:hypothetical protein